jgi:hypothetical protein
MTTTRNTSERNNSSIEVSVDSFTIKNLTVVGKPARVLIASTLDGSNPEVVFDDMLQIGAIALQQSHGESMVRQIEVTMDNFAKTIHKEAVEKFPQQIELKTETLMKDLSKYLDPRIVGSIQEQISSILAKSGEFQLSSIKEELKVHYAKLEEGLKSIQGTKALIENSSSKGIPFQDLVGEHLEVFAGTDDVISNVSAKTVGKSARAGKGNSGDYMVTINKSYGTPNPIAFSVEAKSGELGKDQALRELDANMKNRGVDVGIIVFKSLDDAPTAGKRFKLFPGNRIMAVLDDSEIGLHCAYLLAKHLAVALKKSDSGVVDSADIERLINEVTQHLDFEGNLNREAKNIDLALTRLVKTTLEAREKALKAMIRFQGPTEDVSDGQ